MLKLCRCCNKWLVCFVLVWFVFRGKLIGKSLMDGRHQPGGRILCWIPTSSKSAKAVEIIRRTWGSKCDTLLFFSSYEDELPSSIPLPVNNTYASLWDKTRHGLRYIYDHHLEDADWFFKADDDTYVVMENLRHYVSWMNHTLPMYCGSRRRNEETALGFCEGGSGYLLTKESIRLFIERGHKGHRSPLCHLGSEGSEDVLLGECMERLGVSFCDSRDPDGRERFLQYPLEQHFYSSWMDDTFFFPRAEGWDCCSNVTVSLHKVKGNELLEYDYLAYRLLKPVDHIAIHHQQSEITRRASLVSSK